MTFGHLFFHRSASWLEGGIDLLFPPRCAMCRDDLPQAGPAAADGDPRVLLCPPCRRSLSNDVARCATCGEQASVEAVCRGCRHPRHGCDGLVVLGSYSDLLRTAVLRCKRPAGETLADTLAALLVARHRVAVAHWNIDLVVPVPMHWRRRLLRGTSAAQVLAAGVARRLRLPCRSCIRRSVATRMQNELPPGERAANVADAFRGGGGVAGRTVLLVDDVCTTGATLAACRRVLTAAGARRVYAAVAAKADGAVPDREA